MRLDEDNLFMGAEVPLLFEREVRLTLLLGCCSWGPYVDLGSKHLELLLIFLFEVVPWSDWMDLACSISWPGWTRTDTLPGHFWPLFCLIFHCFTSYACFLCSSHQHAVPLSTFGAAIAARCIVKLLTVEASYGLASCPLRLLQFEKQRHSNLETSLTRPYCFM
jgi:hypothetical protein